ncbi:hypothetical protein C8R43DRAFT_1162119 [Mycena crocata]|nr:hypothetical protein C8R43DRAFT_1162119 [Mycena crocata]
MNRKREKSRERQAFCGEWGVTLMKLKNFEGAAACFADACSFWRSNPVWCCDLATAYLHSGRYVWQNVVWGGGGGGGLIILVWSKCLNNEFTEDKQVDSRMQSRRRRRRRRWRSTRSSWMHGIRGMARKARGMVRGAIVDLETVLELAADNEAAQTALADLRKISLDETAKEPKSLPESESPKQRLQGSTHFRRELPQVRTPATRRTPASIHGARWEERARRAG